MSIDGPIDTFVLQEFRLHTADTAAEAARIVATFAVGVEAAVPLLTSIDDQRDVAIVRAIRAGDRFEADPRERSALDPLVARWQLPRHYGPRVNERSDNRATYYQLAVTESGINNADPGPLASRPPDESANSSSTPLALLWIGLPVGTHAGLMTLVGSEGGRPATREDPRAWPLPFSRLLGVRIYESRH